ncbi:MAG TPA: hypothetical protein VH914_20220 [Acidimicrobiia bacterium]|nr:hypothetical protein [Acidimicrobiia bacterium]
MRKPSAKVFVVALVGAAVFGSFVAGRLNPAAAAAHGASRALSVTPGWECVPSAVGQPVLSGGTAATPSCGAGSTPVLAPTFVSSGVGGKPTVQFSAVNVQILSGSGSTGGPVNGEGNLIVGYGENPGGRRQTGSNNLIVGSANGWTSFGTIVGGYSDQTTGPYASVVGTKNTASGHSSFVAGQQNKASGRSSSVLGGDGNAATANCQSIPAAPGVC